jgi:hypothetical protein
MRNMLLVMSLTAMTMPACDQRPATPTAPSVPAAPAPASAPAAERPTVELHVSGAVLEDADVPVPGAVITSGMDNAVTDAGGSFDMTIHTRFSGEFVTVSKEGYESTLSFAAGSTNGVNTQNFRLYKPRIIDVGESVTLPISTEGSLCGLEGEWACRVIRIVPSRTGTVLVNVSSNDSGAKIEVAMNMTMGYPHKGTSTLTFEATKGTQAAVLVLGAGLDHKPSADFTLTTDYQ